MFFFGVDLYSPCFDMESPFYKNMAARRGRKYHDLWKINKKFFNPKYFFCLEVRLKKRPRP